MSVRQPIPRASKSRRHRRLLLEDRVTRGCGVHEADIEKIGKPAYEHKPLAEGYAKKTVSRLKDDLIPPYSPGGLRG